MRISLLRGRSLEATLTAVWTRLQALNPELASPCFSPEFAHAMAMAREDVEVAVVEEGRNVSALFPFQRRTKGVGLPVGGIVSDYEGLICPPTFECDPRELLKKCGLVAWDYDHLLASQEMFARFHNSCEPSPVIDLSHGFQAYVAERRAAGTEQIKKLGNMLRRLELEVGSVRFVSHSADSALLNQVLSWKSQQYHQAGWEDLFALPWGRRLVECIHATQNPGFAGMLSLLYAGDRCIAGHFGMRSRTIWHYWFPAYDPKFSSYSPGLVLLLKMAEHAPGLGLRRIDLGKGMSLYKRRFMNGSVLLAEGSVECYSGLWLRRVAKRKLKSILRTTGLHSPPPLPGAST